MGMKKRLTGRTRGLKLKRDPPAILRPLEAEANPKASPEAAFKRPREGAADVSPEATDGWPRETRARALLFFDFSGSPAPSCGSQPRCRPTTSQSWEQLRIPLHQVGGFYVLKTGRLSCQGPEGP